MKKLILLAIVFSGLTTSCKKDRVCECTITDDGDISKSTVTYTEISKMEGKKACSKFEISNSNGSSISKTTYDCKLK